jgi:hypothetical protein
MTAILFLLVTTNFNFLLRGQLRRRKFNNRRNRVYKRIFIGLLCQIGTMKKMQINISRAEEIAKAKFFEHFKEDIPEDIKDRLTIGIREDGGEWIVSVLLHPANYDGHNGLAEDLLHPLPETVVEIRVNKLSEQAELINLGAPW